MGNKQIKLIDKEDALITIIVPIYNGQRYLKECIESILRQSYFNIEVILVNDGSTDQSADIINKYASHDKRIKVIHQKNLGVSAARNAALDIALGEYICFVDEDDYLSVDYVSYFYKLIKKYNAEIALTPVPFKFAGNVAISSKDNSTDIVNVWSGLHAVEEMLYYNVTIGPWNKMISRKLIEENKLRFNSSFLSGEGFSYSISCFQKASRVAVGHRKVYFYRLDNPNSVMTKFNLKRIKSSIEAQKYIQSLLLEDMPELLQACKYANWHTCCDCFNMMLGCQVTKQYPKFYQQIKRVCQRDALCALKAPVPYKDKIKGILYFINPFIAAKLINQFRIRKFTIEK